MKRYTLMLVMVAPLCGSGVGCGPSAPSPSTPPTGAASAAPKKNDADNSLVKEARPDTEATLNDLIVGKYDNDQNFYPIARKLKGFRSWSIDSQEVVPDLPKAVRFGGTLKGPTGEATFTATMVKQQNGKWMIGTFEGPNPK
jgi:hypothetical protein